eukprot:6186605-Pleurochrysis_carterae.AAC.1
MQSVRIFSVPFQIKAVFPNVPSCSLRLNADQRLTRRSSDLVKTKARAQQISMQNRNLSPAAHMGQRLHSEN